MLTDVAADDGSCQALFEVSLEVEAGEAVAVRLVCEADPALAGLPGNGWPFQVNDVVSFHRLDARGAGHEQDDGRTRKTERGAD